MDEAVVKLRGADHFPFGDREGQKFGECSLRSVWPEGTTARQKAEIRSMR
jgi:hypothetical protein